MRSAVSVRTYPLGVGTLATGTSGYSVTGLLPAMSAHLHTSPAIAGQLFTVFAVTCALSGPLIAFATRGWDRRRVLVTALSVTGLGNGMAALAPTLTVLVSARIVTALGTAVYTAAAAAMATQLNRPERRARAMSVVFGGLTLALLLGVPMSTALSATGGYKTVFWLVAGLCALSATGIAIVEPAGATSAVAPRRQGLSATTNPQVLAVLGVALLACISTFAVYTYVVVLLASTTGARDGTTSLLLAGYGIGAAIGNVLGGRGTDRFGPRQTLLAAAGACAMLLLVLPIVAITISGAAIALTAWGCAFWMINPPLTSWLVQLAPTRANLLLSLLGSAVYLGMGVGGLLGGLVVALAGPAMLGPVAAVVSAASLLLLIRVNEPAPEPGADNATRDKPDMVLVETRGQP
jgi:predicted MFS family arabinose efflux permease